MKYQFASDNTSGIIPEVWAALERANQGFVPAYGNDEFTAEAANLFRQVFEKDCEVFFVFNGTAANSLALAALCSSYHSVIAHEVGHVETDECGAPEFFSNGTKLLLAPGPDGKFDLTEVERLITKRSDIHYPRPKVITFTQPTELGTLYTVAEIQAVSALARKYGLRVHIDGARFANAVAALQVAPKELTWQAGVDVISFGGTKMGGLSEAIVFFDKTLAYEFDYRCKQAGQLASKMRFLAAPWLPFLKDHLCLRYAAQANRCAQLLRRGLEQLPGIVPLYPTQANAVFVRMPEEFQKALKARGWAFYVFIGGGVRFMCSWKTSEADITELLADLKEICG